MNKLWLFCIHAWSHRHWRLFAWLGRRIAARVTYFPDRWYTRRVSTLTDFGMTQAQIKAVWSANQTYANMDAEIRRQVNEGFQR